MTPPSPAPLLQVRHLRKSFALPAAPRTWALPWGRQRPSVLAVTDVSFDLVRGEALGLVGESGSGKSTTASLVARLADPDGGQILFEGEDIARTPARQAAHSAWRARIQMVFQDPGDSLDPRASAFDAIAAPLRRLRALRGAALQQSVHRAAERAQLPRTLLGHYPHQLSGGQAARVGIARAIALEPALLILDEPTSALDVSVQIGVLQLLDALRRDSGMGYLFVSHDLQVVRLLCQRVLVMQHGRVVESGPTAQVFDHPVHPYAAALAAAVPRFELQTIPPVSPLRHAPPAVTDA
ncbi:ABC transporter ATP-binding protein [Variovorax fucosicus]|uniref:ABC transporter ATP-binding protein n=1 Tax=Variovorax fucosicus TaxID=3053517 RepID=UPI0025782BAF|nr:ABC transporter ATP-binding protein [Variovorax sp. J22G47]MDM0059068.1 ABC transporter ATP-binding protein [Variovorax sp. J22G47]